MEKEQPLQTCPLCGNKATVTRKWVRNRSGKRYDYVLYHHSSITHWSNQNLETSPRLRKKEVQDKLLHLLNSKRFKRVIFTVDELVITLNQEGNGPQRRQIRESLEKLVNEKLVISIREGKKAYFINTLNPDRLSYTIKNADISLENTDEDHSFEKHIFRFEILNDNIFPLQYIQYNTVGDDPREKDRISFSAYDLSKKEKARIYFLEDNPRKKRIIIEFATSILPRERRKLHFEYFWPVTSSVSSFTAPTSVKSLKFSLISMEREQLKVMRTNGQRTEVEDESNRVIVTVESNGFFIVSFEAEELPAFTITKFKWNKLIDQKQEKDEMGAFR